MRAPWNLAFSKLLGRRILREVKSAFVTARTSSIPTSSEVLFGGFSAGGGSPTSAILSFVQPAGAALNFCTELLLDLLWRYACQLGTRKCLSIASLPFGTSQVDVIGSIYSSKEKILLGVAFRFKIRES